MDEIPAIAPWPATPSTIPERMLWLADAYAEGAQVLCNALVEDDYQRQYTNTQVILHLCRHATELFFKGAVAHKTKRRPLKTHRLDRLYAEYRRFYPTEEFDIELPFPRSVLDPEAGLFPELMDDYVRTHDQRFRYPADLDGKPFDERLPFDVLQYQDAIDRFRSTLNWTVAKIAFAWEEEPKRRASS